MRSWRLAAALTLGALFTPAAPAAATQDAAALFSAGSYGAAARTARDEAARPGRTPAQRAAAWLLAADANEQAEGRVEDSDLALAAARKTFGKAPVPALMSARIAAIEASRLRRDGKAAAAARALLKNRASLKPVAGSEEALTLDLADAITLIQTGRAKQAIGPLIALCEARFALPDGDPRTLNALYWLGVAQRNVGQRASASDVLKEVVRIRTLALGATHPDTLAARRVLASALDSGGPAERAAIVAAWTARQDSGDRARLAEAMLDASVDAPTAQARIAALKAAFDTARGAIPPIDRVTGEAAADLAKALQAQGRFGEAIDILSQVTDIVPRLAAAALGDDIQVTRAVLYVALERFDEAEAIYRPLLASYDADPNRSRANRLNVANNLAEILARTNRVSAALALAREVVDGRTSLMGPTAAATLSAKSTLASYLSLSDRPADAIALHREVLAARLAAAPRDERAIASSLHNLAATLEDAGRPGEAMDLAQQALAMRARILGDGHPDTILSRRQLGGLQSAQGLVDEARATYRKVVADLEATRLTATSGERQRRIWFAQYAQVYKWLAMLEAKAGHPIALAYADAARGRTLAEMSGSDQMVDALATPEQARALRAARLAVGLLVAQDSAAMTDAQKSAHGAALDGATARLTALETQLAEQYPKLHFASQGAGFNLAGVRNVLGADGALLSFTVLGDTVLRITIAPTNDIDAEQVRMPALAETIRAYLALLAAPATAGSSADPLADRAVYAWPDGSYRIRRLDEQVPDTAEIVSDAAIVGKLLGDRLLSGLPASILHSPRWVVVPDGALGAIPFDSIERSGEPLAHRTAISYAPSIQLLVALKARRETYQQLARRPMLVVGAPAFSSAPTGSALRGWRDLPGAAGEVAGLRDRYRLIEGGNLFTGTAATEQQIHRLDANGDLDRYRTLVLSTHGLIDVGNAERNAVILLGDGSSPQNDGYLRAAEIMALRLRTDLVIVSACESGVGAWLDGEGSIGLPFALLNAGSAATLLSHWSIADNGSAAFFARFFTKLQAGERASQALWHTKRDFADGLEGERWRAPAYWAAFSLYGTD